MNQDKDKFVIELENKVVVLSINPFDADLDVDELTKIHYHNILGEVLTCSVLLNRVGNLLAEVNANLSESKLDFEIFSAQMQEEKRKTLTFTDVDSKGNEKVSKPTVAEVENSVTRTPQYKVKKKNIIRLQKEVDYVNSLYWAVKDKCEKVNKLTEKIRPEDFENEILEESINGIMVKVKNKLIK
jgi:hypothetical protein